MPGRDDSEYLRQLRAYLANLERLWNRFWLEVEEYRTTGASDEILSLLRKFEDRLDRMVLGEVGGDLDGVIKLIEIELQALQYYNDDRLKQLIATLILSKIRDVLWHNVERRNRASTALDEIFEQGLRLFREARREIEAEIEFFDRRTAHLSDSEKIGLREKFGRLLQVISGAGLIIGASYYSFVLTLIPKEADTAAVVGGASLLTSGFRGAK